jgi:hypothetical protein
MAHFEELQELWQNQASPFVRPMDVRGVAEQLRRFGRNQMWINGIKLTLLVSLNFRLMSQAHWALLPVAGTILMFIGLLLYLVLDWRNQIGLSRLDFSAPSVEFVHRTRERLQHQLNPMRKLFWVFVVTIGGGFNLILMGRSQHSGAARIADHVGATALPFFAYVLGVRIREFRFRRECGAVLEKVDALVRNMEDQA